MVMAGPHHPPHWPPPPVIPGNILTPLWKVAGVSKAKRFKGKHEAKLKFPEGGGGWGGEGSNH